MRPIFVENQLQDFATTLDILESRSMDHFVKSRVTAESIEGRIGFQKGDICRPVLKGLVEGVQSLIFVADECR